MKTLLSAALAAVLFTAPAIGQDALISLDSPIDATVISMQWVKPDANGTINGTVVIPGADGADLSGDLFLAAQQSVPMRVPVSPAGKFALQAVPAGVYTLVYQAPQAFGAYALHVVSASSDAKLSSNTVVTAAALDPETALTTVAKYQPTELAAAADISGIRVSDGLAGSEAGLESMDIAQVGQTASGGMRGRLIRAGSVANGLLPATDMNVMLMRNGELVDKGVTGEDGTFSFDNLATGYYELVASGLSGFAVIGFQLVEGPEVLTNLVAANAARAPQPAPASTLVLQVAEPDPNLIGGTPGSASPNDDPTSVPQPLANDPFMAGAPAGGGFAGGGFAGGGGGFGGGGGGGGLGAGGFAGLAAVGAVLAATLSDDDDDDSFVPRPSSPAIP